MEYPMQDILEDFLLGLLLIYWPEEECYDVGLKKYDDLS